ncbi:MAG: hypothetical protein LBT96_01600 [Campylobacteraceae bacterium]|jgi:hypothetical protein|nr:hypothetical protein [Campylobacteraceae bacterium]
MKKIFFFLAAVAVCVCFAKTDSEIKQEMITKSKASYPGNCPCPYNTMKNGRSCGKTSAWSRAGGYSPLCYESDITPEMLESYKKRNK